MTIKAIETQYKGYRFRSRLEARWAVFFDALGLAWEYEPEGFELGGGVRYLPDFRVRYPGRGDDERHSEWFEVKGDLTEVTSDEWSKMLRFAKGRGLTILDGTPDCRMYLSVACCIDYDFFNYDEGCEKVLVPPFKIDPRALTHKRDGYALWCPKGRMWWDNHDDFFRSNGYGTSDGELQRAVRAARSARFEFGECFA